MITATFCKRCPRRGNCRGPVSSEIKFRTFNLMSAEIREGLATQEKEDVPHGLTKKFYNSDVRGSGLSDDMPIETTLDDIANCETPEIIARGGVLKMVKRYECGAFLAAALRQDLHENPN